MKKVCFDGIDYVYFNWEELDRLCFDISKKVMEDGEKFDRIVTLAKGGWPMTRTLCDYLGIEQIASIGVKFYKDIGKREIEPVIYQELPIKVRDESILLFDDVADTGESLDFAKNYLEKVGAKEIKIVTIFTKPSSKIKPDYFGKEVNEWIIFPFEIRESVELISKKWRESGLRKEEILDRFVEMGMNEEKVKYFLDL